MPIKKDKQRTNYTKTDIAESLRSYAKEKGATVISQKEYRKEGRVPSVSTIKRYFGSWEEAIREAGLEKLTREKRQPTEEDILLLLKGYIDENGGTLPIAVYEKKKKKDDPSRKFIARLFGTWNKAVQMAGGKGFTFYTEEEMIASLQRAAKENGGKISYNRYQEMGYKPSSSVIVQRFGTWNKALEEASLDLNKEKELWYTREDCIQQIKACAEENDGVVGTVLYELSGRKPTYDTILRYFGSWEAALKEVGITHIHQFYSKENMLAILRAVYRLHGRITPKIYESTEGVPHLVTVYRIFGNWEKAMEEAGLTDERNRLSEEEILENVRLFANRCEGVLTQETYEQMQMEPDLSTLFHRFGSFHQVLERAGLVDEQRKRIIQDVCRVMEDNHPNITFQDYQKAGGEVSYTMMSRYGGSWSNIVEQAIHYKETGRYKEILSNRERYFYSDEMMLHGIRRFSEENDGSTSEALYMAQKRKPTAQAIRNRFGGWKEAVRKAMDLKTEKAGE